MPRRETRIARPDFEINRQVDHAFTRSLDGRRELGVAVGDASLPPASMGRMHYRFCLAVDSREIDLTLVQTPNPPYQRLGENTLARIMHAFETRVPIPLSTMPHMRHLDNPYADASNRSRAWEDDRGQMWLLYAKCSEFAIVEESHGLDEYGNTDTEPAPYHHMIDRVTVEMVIDIEFVAIPNPLLAPTPFVWSVHPSGPTVGDVYAGGFHVNVDPPTLPQEPEEEVDLLSLKNTLKHSLKGLGEGCRELRMANLNGEGGFSDN